MILNPKKRRRKAFALAFKIIFSYLTLKATKKLISVDSYQSKLNRLHKNNALRLKNTLLELNGLFIKVGQLLSILSNIIPKEFGEILESLQDNTPHSPYSMTKETIEHELEDTLENIFERFEEIPIASASIGQVHKAKLKTGETVAVKIQHPYIKELAVVDLNIVESIHKKVSRIFKINGIDHAFEQVKLMIHEELDYDKEAVSMQLIKENCKEISGVYIPDVHTAYCSSMILTTTFCEGVKITNKQQLAEWNLNANEIADKLVFTYCEMLLNHGIYHADPHPGNLMVNQQGNLILLDFGAVGELKEEMRVNLPPFLQAIISEDSEKVMESLQKMGFVGIGKEKDKATKKIIEALTEFLQDAVNLDNLNIENIKETSLFKLQKELSIKELTTSLNVPKDWILLERTFLILYGICTTIAPDYKAMGTIRPYLKKLVLKDGGLKKIILDTIKQQATTLFSLPKKVDTYLSKANRGELEVTLKNFDSNTNKIIGFGTSLFFGLFGILSLIGALISNHWKLKNYEFIFLILSITFGILFIYKLWKNRKV